MGRLKHVFIIAYYLLIGGLFILFAIANREPVTISFFPLEYELILPKFLFAIFLFILGLITCWLMLSWSRIKLKYDNKSKQKRIEALENELSAYKVEAATKAAIEEPTKED